MPVSSTEPSSAGSSTVTNAYTSNGQPSCGGSAIASAGATCQQDPGPAPVAPGGTITPPSSAPPAGITWTLYDTTGNQLYSTTGVYPPGNTTTASYLQTTYQLFSGNTVTLGSTTIGCTHAPPSPSLPCAKINADGVVTQLGYDSAGDLTSSSTPDGNGSELATTTGAYDNDGEQTSTTAPDGNLSGANAGNYTTVTAYNSDEDKTTVTQGGGSGATVTPRTTTYGYDADGNQVSVKDARGYSTATAYNADDQATLVTDPDGHATLTCYDGDGNTAQTVPAVGVAANSLTPASRPASYPAGYGTRLAADATVTTYNADGGKTKQLTPAPAGQSGYETTTYTYDSAGNQTQVTAPPTTNGGSALVTIDTYTPAGQVATETTGSGTSAASTISYCYDPDGNETSVVYADGSTSGVAPCETTYPYVVSASAHPAQAAYQTTYGYDSGNEQVSITAPAIFAAPSGSTTTSTYDPAGNRLTSTDPAGITTTWAYTPGNLETGVSYSGSSAHSVAYTYDADGSKTGITDATGTSGYIYDPFGELTSATNGAGKAVAYSYDPDGDVTSIGYPLPATAIWATSDTVRYGYDHAGQLASVTDFNGNQLGITVTADGQPNAITLGATGDTLGTTYDQADQVSQVSLNKGSSILGSFGYGYSPASTILNETDTPASPQSPAAYSYDAQGRVTSMTPGTSPALTYGYDPSGNLTTLPASATGNYVPPARSAAPPPATPTTQTASGSPRRKARPPWPAGPGTAPASSPPTATTRRT